MYCRWNPLCSRWSERAASRSSMLISDAGSGTYFLYLTNFMKSAARNRDLVVWPALTAEIAFVVIVTYILLFATRLFLASGEHALLAAADAFVRVESLENEFCGRHQHFCGLF